MNENVDVRNMSGVTRPDEPSKRSERPIQIDSFEEATVQVVDVTFRSESELTRALPACATLYL